MIPTLKRVVARIDWPQFILTTLIGTVIGYYIARVLKRAEGKPE